MNDSNLTHAVLKAFQDLCHDNAKTAGWWGGYFEADTKTQDLIASSKIALIHSEVSEGHEGLRKNLKDDHLPHRDMLEVELADAVIRIMDLAGARGYDVFAAAIEKIEYNKSRADHKPENRAATGGKAF